MVSTGGEIPALGPYMAGMWPARGAAPDGEATSAAEREREHARDDARPVAFPRDPASPRNIAARACPRGLRSVIASLRAWLGRRR